MSENPRWPYLLSAALALPTDCNTTHSLPATISEGIAQGYPYIHVLGVLKRPNGSGEARAGNVHPDNRKDSR